MMSTTTTTTTTKELSADQVSRWAGALRIGMALAEQAERIEGAERFQVLDGEGKVLFTAEIGGMR